MNKDKGYDLIKSPIRTEKTTFLQEQNKYSFYVDSKATKFEVEKAVEDIFAVKVKKVNIINVLGKTKRFKGIMGKKNDKKKALVTLDSDCTIDFNEGVK